MFATLKRAAKALPLPAQIERDMAYLNEARERTLHSRARRGYGL